jgi:5'(3')-deoxyribonucleotidase
MAEVTHILLDLDGVVANFLDPALKLWGFDPANYPANEFEIATVLGISLSDFCGMIDRQPNYWRDIEPYPWKDDLVGLLNDLNIRWSVLTSPWKFQHPTMHSDKADWVRRHIGPDVKCIIGDEKYLLAKPQNLLIDDSNANVASFMAHGGRTVLFPQRWNELHYVGDQFGFAARAIMEAVE